MIKVHRLLVIWIVFGMFTPTKRKFSISLQILRFSLYVVLIICHPKECKLMLKMKLTYIIKQILYLTDRMICYQFIFSLCWICLLKQEMSEKHKYPLVQNSKGLHIYSVQWIIYCSNHLTKFVNYQANCS